MMNAFHLAFHLIRVILYPDVFLQFYRLAKLSNQPMFSSKPVRVKVDGGVALKVGRFAKYKDFWGS